MSLVKSHVIIILNCAKRVEKENSMISLKIGPYYQIGRLNTTKNVYINIYLYLYVILMQFKLEFQYDI